MIRKAVILLLSMLTLWATVAVAAPSNAEVATMLERVLPAVVTVVIDKRDDIKTPYGFSGNAVAVAYRKTLDLTDAASTGSGFIIRHDGQPYVVTNAHVIEQAAGHDAITAYTLDQTQYPLRIVGADSFYDIAVLAFRDEVPTTKISSVSFKSLYQIYFFNFQSIVFSARRQIFENGGFQLMVIKYFSAYSCS
jgi:S1-C subfamily serine protease